MRFHAVKSRPQCKTEASFMTPPDWLWAVFTVIAAFAQVFRNAAQRSLTERLGTTGATHVRFLFGLPFGLLALAAAFVAGFDLPSPNAAFLAWVIFGGIAQIAATGLMLTAMQSRSFVVTTAYTKTEPVQVALFGLIFLGEHVTAPLAAAILIATTGVMVLSWPRRTGSDVFSWRPALLGIASGGLFALAAIGFRGGIISLENAAYLPAATLTLAVALSIQTATLTVWLLLRDPGVLAAIARAWRRSMAAGFLGAFASQMWFMAFALETAARVRTLALVEILIAAIVSRRLFAQTSGMRDAIGMGLVVAGVVLLLNR